MTDQTVTAPSTAVTFARAALTNVGGFFKAIGLAMMANSSLQKRVENVHILQAKSDKELAALNIKREDIVQEVFKDLYYA